MQPSLEDDDHPAILERAGLSGTSAPARSHRGRRIPLSEAGGSLAEILTQAGSGAAPERIGAGIDPDAFDSENLVRESRIVSSEMRSLK